MQTQRLLLFALAPSICGACSDDANNKHDAAVIDASPDSKPIDAGICTPQSATASGQLFFIGEYVDWTSDDAIFCGILGAKWQVHGDPTRVDSPTPPNGRVTLCLADAPTTQIDITPPVNDSECTNPQSPYTIPGVAIVTKDALITGDLFSARSITTAELATFFTAQALGTIDPTKAQVFVHEEGTAPRAVAITATHAAAQAFDGATWAAGTTGKYVYFPNVDVTTATTDISVTGGAIGTTTVPLTAGTFTYLTVVSN
jgi:hypothetical protein